MAQNEHLTRIRGLKLDTHPDEQRQQQDVTNSEQRRPERPSYHVSIPSEDTIRACATPPIGIPGQHEEDTGSSATNDETDSYVSDFLENRRTSIQFSSEARTSSGHRYSIPLEPSKRPVENGIRGRSFGQALSEHHLATRAHSESERSHYDPHTGRHLPQYSDSPPHDRPQVGEPRFPLLQQTVDALAGRSSDMQHPMSLTSESTASPVEEVVVTPGGSEGNHVTSPVNIMPSIVRHLSTSYDSPRPRTQRKASERWRDGQVTQDLFSRAGSVKKGDRDLPRRASRRDTQSSTKSPHSAASSFLRGFSLNSGNDDSAPPAVDAEGATVGEDYVLGKQIGYGGFSIIREVKQIQHSAGGQRTLAVKIVKKQIDGKTREQNELAQSEFEHEVDLWRLLNHKHILSLEAVYELKEATFCFIPLNVGGTLFDVLTNNRQGLPIDVAASYSYQLASALRYLHLDAHVVHRDIKLENCLIDTTLGEPGFLRVCDFGLAEWISSDNDSAPGSSSSDASEQERQLNKYFGPADSSSSAFAGGSLEYAAPEILRIATSSSGHVQHGELPPQQSIVSPAVDIWAMGICIYALLVGRRPFQDSFQPRVVMAILAGDWDKAALKDKVAGQLDAYKLVKSCLDMNGLRRAVIGEVVESSWFDEVRNSAEGSDAESENARANAWRL